MIDCALITDDEQLRLHVRNLVRRAESPDRLVLEVNENASRLSRDRVAEILAAKPGVAFVDLGDSATGLRVLELLSREAPDMKLIAAGASLSADALLQVMRAGASEYLPRPIEFEEVTQAFTRIRRRAGVHHGDEPADNGQVTTLFSPKGGVGVTTVAVNLAVVLREATQKRTILVDLAASLGTVALSMGLQSRYSYLDIIKNFHRMDDELFRSFLEVHESGVHVLASPAGVRATTHPSMDEIRSLLRFCRRQYENVVVDAGHTLTDAAEAALLEADHRLLVSTPELPTLRNLKRVLEVITDHKKNGKAPPRLVLNQYAEGLGVSVTEVERGLGLSVDTVIDRDADLISESINLGRPAVTVRRSSFDKAMTGLGRRVARPDTIVVQRAGLFQSLLKPFRPSVSGAQTKETN